jgi:hypothetical protein
MSLTFARTHDRQRLVEALATYYASLLRPGGLGAARASEQRLIAWEDGVEPPPSAPLRLYVSPLTDGWLAAALTDGLMPVTFDLPLTAWLARTLKVAAVAAYTWGDGYGCVAFNEQGLDWTDAHIRDERSDMHLRQILHGAGIPFDGVEDRRGNDRAGWHVLDIPPRFW